MVAYALDGRKTLSAMYAATSKVIAVFLATKPIDENDGKDEGTESTAYSEATFEQEYE